MVKDQVGELDGLEFVKDIKVDQSSYTGYVNAIGQKHGLGEELMDTGDVYEGEYKDG